MTNLIRNNNFFNFKNIKLKMPKVKTATVKNDKDEESKREKEARIRSIFLSASNF